MTTAHRQKTALITGASSGIGYELTQLFARDGYDLVLLARSQARLAQLADDLRHRYGVAVRVLAYDLARPTAPTQIVAQLQQDDLIIEALVNNAGFATYGPFLATDLATELEMIQVNVVALTQLTKLLLPGMLQRRSGRILNVASTAAFQPGPLTAVYSATKAYVLSFSEALANEVRGSGVWVTTLCPGPTRSGFQRRAQMEHSHLMRGELMDAATVARAGYAGLMQGRTVVIPGLRNRLLVEVVRFTPRALVTQVVRRMQERVS